LSLQLDVARMSSPPDAIAVGSVMHAGIVTCRPDDSLRTVAALLAAHRIHAVVVAGGDDRAPSAVVTDRDVVYGHSAGRIDELTAGDAATEPTVTVRPDVDLRHASELMTRHGTMHIIVTEGRYGAAVGILSSLDVAAAVGGR
jgi:CBS domain-containing protein